MILLMKQPPAVEQESQRAEATNYDNGHKKEPGSPILWLRTCATKPLLHWQWKGAELFYGVRIVHSDVSYVEIN